MHRACFPEIHLKGIPLSSGVAVGRACFYRREATNSEVTTAGGQAYERRRLNASMQWMTRRLTALIQETEAKLGPDEADIFRSHRMIVEDEFFQEQLVEIIESTGLSAEDAVKSHLDEYLAQLRGADSEYLRQRTADISEIQQSLLEHLRQASSLRHCQDMTNCTIGQCPLKNSHILVADEMSPSLPIEVGSFTVGFLVEKGGPDSHAAILARGLQLPAVGGIRDLFATVPLQSQLLINGNTGEIIINPSKQTRLRSKSAMANPNRTSQVHNPITELQVMANISRVADVQEALAAKADGIGLYRTEMEALMEGRLLSEQEQTTLYTKVTKAMAGKPVYIRLFDFGGDKAATWLGIPRSENPALGTRGAQLLLARPELLRTQARALAKAAIDHRIHVIYPMIIDLDQFQRIRACFDAAVADLKPSNLRHGVLFEVPSACLQARQILREADFGCIGTNDLTQYLFAADRMSEAVTHAALSDHPALWNLIADLTQAGKDAGKPMSICGECAGNVDLIRKVMRAGLTAISTTATCIGDVRRAAKNNHGGILRTSVTTHPH